MKKVLLTHCKGEKIKKSEFIDWGKEFDSNLKKFINFPASHNISSEEEK